jgi:hypothetical protein
LLCIQGRSCCEGEALGIANGEGLRAFLHDAGSEGEAIADGQIFANDAYVVAGIQFKVISLKNAGVTEVHIHLAGSGLE